MPESLIREPPAAPVSDLCPEAPAPPPPRPRLGLVVAALALGGFAIGTTEFVAMGLLPQIAGGVGISIPTAGHVVSAYAIGVVVGAPVLAGLGAKFPRRTLLVALMVAFAAGNLLSALAPSYPLLVGARFLAGLPHGAYFGVAALVAADMAGPERRARAISRVLLGLSVANVLGVPVATWLGQTFGWRVAFAAAAVLAALTAISVRRVVPWAPADRGATLRRELTALRRPQVLLAVATGAVGGGGMFAVYSYISPILTDRSGLALGAVPIALAVWGLGMVAGNLAGGRLMDWRPVPVMFAVFLLMAAMFAVFTVTSAHAATALVTVFVLGMSLILPTGLQMRLMNVAGEAQTLGAALNHSAFNIANALGAWLGGLTLAAGWGLTAPMWVAVGLTLSGMAIFGASLALERRTDARGAAAAALA
ncbi:MAG TPA: MFS transporter [Baekduia sp.]|uniref:MFS transporter n=1 Tax=Baekduia sp. TaxID=2600305 RepID=UPI002B645E0B|nr:MFS transporter [Baekduia sp.]HMJ32795.1 MFS transporter [Baekduia sp.]